MERVKARRSTCHAQNLKIIDEASASLQSSNNDLSKFISIRDRLLTSNNELRRINNKIDPLIPADELKGGYTMAAEYGDQAVVMLLEFNC